MGKLKQNPTFRVDPSLGLQEPQKEVAGTERKAAEEEDNEQSIKKDYRFCPHPIGCAQREREKKPLA